MKNYRIISKKPNILWMQDKVIDEYQRINTESYRVEELEMEDILSDSPYKIQKLDNITNFISHITGFETEKYIKYVAKGNEFIRIVNLNEFFINTEDVKYIDESIYNILTKYHLDTGDILLSKDGTIGVASIVDEGNVKSIASSHVVTIKSKKEEIDPYYLVTFLNSKYGQFQFARMSTGSIQKALNVEKIRGTKIPVPCKNIQKYIGDKVKKAEKLREEAKRLKKEALQIFNDIYQQVNRKDQKYEWVKECYLSEDNVIPNFYKQYDLLKDKNHEFLEFVEIVDNIKCGIAVRSDNRIGNRYPFYGASGISDNIDDYNFEGEHLIVAQDGSVGAVNVARNKFWANNHVWVVKVNEEWDVEFIELYMKQYNYWSSLTTGSVVPKVTSENLRRLLIPKIEYEIQVKIGELLRKSKGKEEKSGMLIREAKQDIEDLIEGNFDLSKIEETN